jgi:3-dehydroquinate dehydratase-2
LALEIPVVEVHLSNLFKREEFRHHSYITPAAQGLICGLGAQGYLMAIDYLSQS